MKIALEITPNLEPLFGTRDENLRLMEDSLGVRIDLRSDAVHVEGPEDSINRVRAVFQDFEALRRQGLEGIAQNAIPDLEEGSGSVNEVFQAYGDTDLR